MEKNCFFIDNFKFIQTPATNSQYPTSTQPETPSSPAARPNNKVGVGVNIDE